MVYVTVYAHCILYNTIRISLWDLGITFDVKLNLSSYISEKVNKANSILGIIKRIFRNLSQESFVMLHKAQVRSHLEYANAVWSP